MTGPAPRLLVLALALALAPSSPVPLVAQAAEDDARPQDARAGVAGDTLTLEEALATALDRNPDMRAAAARASAEAVARWADWGAFLPTATVSTSFSRSNFTNFTFVSPEGVSRRLDEAVRDVSKSTSQGLNLSLDLLRGGQRFTELSAGAARREAADLRLSTAERSVVAEVKVAYFETLKRQRLAEVAQRQLEARREDLENARERYRIAAADRRDLLGAEVEVSRAELAALEARDEVTRQRRGLRVAMGLAEDAGPGGAGPEQDRTVPLRDVEELPGATGLEPTDLTERALAAHPELAALEREAAAASSELWGARSRYLPDVSVSYSLGRSEQLGTQDPLFEFDPSDRSGRLSLTASWSLFSGFERRERTARAGADLQIARAERTRQRLELRRELRDLIDEIHRRDRRLRLLQGTFDLAEQRLELARERYRLGSIEFFELQSAIREVTTAERDLYRERYDYLIARARLQEHAGAALR